LLAAEAPVGGLLAGDDARFRLHSNRAIAAIRSRTAAETPTAMPIVAPSPLVGSVCGIAASVCDVDSDCDSDDDDEKPEPGGGSVRPIAVVVVVVVVVVGVGGGVVGGGVLVVVVAIVVVIVVVDLGCVVVVVVAVVVGSGANVHERVVPPEQHSGKLLHDEMQFVSGMKPLLLFKISQLKGFESLFSRFRLSSTGTVPVSRLP
jgi:hypothetical protein